MELGRAFRHRDHPGRRLHGHEREAELNLLVRGACRYLVDGRRCDLAPGHLLWLPPGRAHLLVDADPGSELWVAMIDLAALRRRCPQAPTAGMRRGAPAPLRPLARPAAAALAGLLALAAEAGDPARREAALALAALEAWHAFATATAAGESEAVHPAAARAAALLADQPGLDQADLAQACGLGGDALGRLFRRDLGTTITAYRQRCRLQRFQDLRGAHPRRTLLWCALAAGFGSYAQFHRVHRRLTGVTPAAR